MFGDLYSMEADNDEIDINPETTINAETAVDDGEAGSDSVTTDVSDIDQKTEDHNEEASAGGVSTGNNQDDITMDPVAATEAYVLRHFGLSQEDIDESIQEAVDEGEEIPNTDEADDVAIVDEDGVGMSEGDATVSTTNAIVKVTDTSELPEEGNPVEVPVESASDVAALESLRRILSKEDVEDTSVSGNADVELDVKTGENDVNLQFEGQSTTITPNDTSASDTGDQNTTETPEGEQPPAENEGGSAEGGEPGTEGGAAEGGEAEPNAENTTEAWTKFMF